MLAREGRSLPQRPAVALGRSRRAGSVAARPLQKRLRIPGQQFIPIPFQPLEEPGVGDSGGPVIQGNTLEDAKLVGIISWGTIECDDDGKPGVYTRVASHADWIKSVIGREALED